MGNDRDWRNLTSGLTVQVWRADCTKRQIMIVINYEVVSSERLASDTSQHLQTIADKDLSGKNIEA